MKDKTVLDRLLALQRYNVGMFNTEKYETGNWVRWDDVEEIIERLERLQALEELAQEAQELDMGYNQ